MNISNEIRQRNLLDIIRVIRKNGQITKPEVARLANLTNVTAHNYIAELTGRNFLIEDGIASSNGGRKAILYKINPEFGYILGQNIGRDYIKTCIFDINLKILYCNKVNGSTEYSSRVANLMNREIKDGIEKLNLKYENCIGMGVSVPGQVDHENGIVLNLTNVPGWRNIPIKGIIESNYRTPVFIDNDNNVNALVVKWMNIVDEASDAVFISITSGVGLGILTKGRLFYGSHTSVGEIGHTTIQYDGPKCNCGNRGCIEVLASDAAIIEKVKRIKKNQAGSGNTDSNEIDIEAVIKLAKEGDEVVYNILKQAAEFISIAIDHIVKLYGPDVIIIESNWLKDFKELFEYVADNVFSRCAWIGRDNLHIKLNTVDSIESIGAGALVLENIFQHSNENSLIKMIIG